jgi:hypothetical protein
MVGRDEIIPPPINFTYGGKRRDIPPPINFKAGREEIFLHRLISSTALRIFLRCSITFKYGVEYIYHRSISSTEKRYSSANYFQLRCQNKYSSTELFKPSCSF